MASHTVSQLHVRFFPAEAADSTSDGRAEAPAVSADSKGLGCIRGLRYAILFEIAAGLCAYEVWRLFRG